MEACYFFNTPTRFIIMYVRKIRMMANDQFCFRMTVMMISTSAHAASTSLSVPILTFPSAPFLNFIENIGISQTSKADRMTESTGMLHFVAAHAANVLSGHFVT